MRNSSHREVACAILLDVSGRFLLQKRDDAPGIVDPGRVGLFGGHREAGETYIQCVVREIHEEIGHFVPATAFAHLTSYDGSDPENEGGTVHVEFFLARNLTPEDFVITEGSLLIIEADDLVTLDSALTATARFALRTLAPSLLSKKNTHPRAF